MKFAKQNSNSGFKRVESQKRHTTVTHPQEVWNLPVPWLGWVLLPEVESLCHLGLPSRFWLCSLTLPFSFRTGLCLLLSSFLSLLSALRRLESPKALLVWTTSVPFGPILWGVHSIRQKPSPQFFFFYFRLKDLMLWDYILNIIRNPIF